MLAPLDEFFSEGEAGRRTLLLLAVALVLAALPIVWWIGSLLSRSMRSLAAEMDRIQRFDMEGETRDLNSSIREIRGVGQKFIEDVYNAKRMHSALGYQSPNEFEAQLAQQAA